jgi:type IX secretion system PorP/SprF family membrane protein
MNRLLLIISIFLILALQTNAQQRPQFSQYMLNNFLINPAIAGIEDYADVRVSNRRQWQGLDGAPVTYYLTAHTSLNKGASGTKYHKGLAHHGVGVSFHTDKTGPLRRTALMGSYAYHMPVTRTINVSAGASAGVIRNSINSSELKLANPSDPLLGSGNISNSVLDLNLGLWLYSQNFSVGVAGAQLLENAGSFEPEGSRNPSLDLQRHYFITGSYRITPTPDFDVIPSVMVKLADPSPTSIDGSLRVLYKKQFWVGAGYRHEDALVAMVGVYVNPLIDVSYSYDATLSNLNRVSSGTHEVVVGFKLLNTKRVICPQWIW